MNNDVDFDKDFQMEEEQFAELDAFLLAYQEELYKSTQIKVVNPLRLKEFQDACTIITKIIRTTSPDAKIEYGMDKLGLGSAYIEAETDEFVVLNIKEFIDAIQFSNNFEIHPLLNGNIKFSITFKRVMEAVSFDD